MTCSRYSFGSGGAVTGTVVNNITGVGVHPVHMTLSHTAKHLLVAGYQSGT